MEYFGWGAATRAKPWSEQVAIARTRLAQSDRALMIGGALRAWRDGHRLWGIGPGMHQHLWPHYAATPDGDPAARRRPRFSNQTFHSYEVHSDWVQLLEEYGLAGLLLFAGFAAALLRTLAAGWRAAARAPAARGGEGGGAEGQPAVLAALLAGTALAFHSLGDFNLQMPATVWVLSALLAAGVAAASEARAAAGAA